MDAKEAERLVRSLPAKEGERVEHETFSRRQHGDHLDRNYKEDAMIEAIDQRMFLEKHAEWITKLQEGQIDVPQFINALSPSAALKLCEIALGGGKGKVQLDALKDLLDRAGYSKVQKVALANIDPNQPKEQLLSMIEGLNRKNKVLEIIDEDDEDQPKGT